MRLHRLLATLSLPLAVAACAEPDLPADVDAGAVAPAEGGGSLFGAGQLLKRWTKNRLSVCFVKAEGFIGDDWTPEKAWHVQQEAREVIRTAVEETWGAQTRFDFDWLGECATRDTSAADITIAAFNASNTLGLSQYGTNSKLVFPSMKLNMPCETKPPVCLGDGDDQEGMWPSDRPNYLPLPRGCSVNNGVPPPADWYTCVYVTAVHEFGHALGLAHEHARSDKPATCTSSGEDADAGHRKLWPYDGASKMNYCAPDLWTRFTPSPGDLRTISTLYNPHVMIYTSPGYAGGPTRVLGPGTYTGLGPVRSVVVAPGYTARMCNAAGVCWSYTESSPTVPSYIGDGVAKLEVTSAVWAFEHPGFMGRNATYGVGVHMGAAIDRVCNDCISSVIVPLGYDARLCWHEASGAGDVCTVVRGGPESNLALNDTLPSSIDNQTSYLQVIPKVVLYTDRALSGRATSYPIGLTSTGPLRAASSILVHPGYNAKLCTSAGTGSGGGTCQTFTQSGDLPPGLEDNVGYLESWQTPIIFLPGGGLSR